MSQPHPLSPALRAAAVAALFLVLGCGGAGLLAACGGSSSGATTPTASATSPRASVPAPGGSPMAGTPEQAAATYWALVDADEYERLAAVCVPGSSAAVSSGADTIARVRLLRISHVTREPGAAELQVDVRVTPAGETTPWGETGRHTLFMQLQRSGSGWLVASWGTSP